MPIWIPPAERRRFKGLDMAHKTKATMPGRQCSTENREQDQHTRPVAGGQSLSAPEITRTAPLARFTPVLAFTPKRGNTQYFPQWGECEPVVHTLFLRTSLGCVQILPLRSPVLARSNYHQGFKIRAGVQNLRSPVLGRSNIGYQPFGSMPCRRNSARASSFNQLPRLTPSRSAASLSCCRNSGVIRIWKVGDSPPPFGVLSRLIVDMYVRNLIAWILLCTYVITTNMQKTTPRTAGTVPGRLTSTDKLRIEEAMKDHITHPQGRNNYTWRFLAINRHDKKAKPCRLSVEAATEREARRILAPHFILSLAARLPVREVFHA